MELSARLMAQICGNCATGQHVREKRASIRLPLGRKGLVLRRTGRSSEVVRELSATGASLLASEPLPEGEELILCIPCLAGPTSG